MIESKDKEFGNKLSLDNNIKIVNIVAIITFLHIEKISLVSLLEKIENIKYNPEVFPGAILRLKKPKATFLIFSSGKMIVSGVRSIQTLPRATKAMLQKLEETGVKYKEPNIQIVNMIGTAKISDYLNLELIALYLENCLYDPTIFPAVIYHLKDPKASFLLFSTGKIICVGLTKKEDFLIAIAKLKGDLNQLEVNITDSTDTRYEEPFFI